MIYLLHMAIFHRKLFVYWRVAGSSWANMIQRRLSLSSSLITRSLWAPRLQRVLQQAASTCQYQFSLPVVIPDKNLQDWFSPHTAMIYLSSVGSQKVEDSNGTWPEMTKICWLQGSYILKYLAPSSFFA